MSKSALKKELSKLTKEVLIKQILDLYEKNTSVKEFYGLYFNSTNEKELIKKYKKVIRNEFNVENPMRSGEKFSVAKKAISEFKSINPSSMGLADVMLYLPESACQLTALYGDYSESFYNSAIRNYQIALVFMSKHDLLDHFQERALQCVKWSSPCGYGFADDIEQLYNEFYS